MKAVLGALVWLLVTVAGAHALAYTVVKVLPDPLVSILGFQSASPEARAAIAQAHPARSYPQIIEDLGRGDLGRTLDGVNVGQEISASAVASLPRLVGAAGLVFAVAILVALLPYRALHPAARFGSLLAFFPPFIAPFLMMWVFVAIQWQAPTAALDLEPWLSGLAIALPAAAFAAAQAAAVTQRNLSLPFAVTIRALGATPLRLRVRLLHHLLVEMAPTLEKLAIGLVTALLFAESIFGQSGLGSLALRAIRRTDLDLILAIVGLNAILIGVLRLGTTMLRASYGVSQR